MTERINIKYGGPSSDVEAAYIKRAIPILPDPPGIPFHKQGSVLPDPYQKHTQYKEILQATTFTDHNDLPFEYWIGTSIPQVHKGGPTFSLGVNEDRK